MPDTTDPTPTPQVGVVLFDRRDRVDGDLGDGGLRQRVADAQRWAEANGVAILEEYIARGHDAAARWPHSLRAALAYCVAHRLGLLVHDARRVLLAPELIELVRRELGVLPLLDVTASAEAGRD